jgi:L-asparaginase
MKIRILITGGTLDKRYDELQGALTFTESGVPEILAQVRYAAPCAMETVFLVDSLHITDTDRQRILEACRRSAEDRIVVTHGTDTMAETARLLGASLRDKTIVLTGAMIPYAFPKSDALFNFGAAITAALLLPAGAYVAMNGRIFTWDNVRKDQERGMFDEIRVVK